jgi:CRISPR-associated protein Csx17
VSTTTFEHCLAGCRPQPLASYLKALAVLRVISEQADADARGGWSGDTFVLHTSLDRDALRGFFVEKYEPTPIIAPWNGGSGFYPKDNQTAITTIRTSSVPRLAMYRRVVEQATQLLCALGIEEKVDKETKPRLLEACRATLDDDVLPWLDAAYLLSDNGPSFPPLLGTGGNDGRLEFTNNFMQRCLDVVDAGEGTGMAAAGRLLTTALFGDSTDGLQPAAIGQFAPGDAGGANAASGFDGRAAVNPWDFLLMLEGAMVFAVAAARRLGHAERGGLGYPFTVRQSAAGYGSAAGSDAAEARGEIWMPLWTRMARFPEVRALFSEGRARLGRRPARDGVDFARAISSLGVDRGISEFQRYGLQVRNGLAYFATPLSRAPVRSVSAARLIDQLDWWLGRFRSAASGEHAPPAAKRAMGDLDDALLSLCLRGDRTRVIQVLMALGECERVLARSARWARNEKRPVPPAPLLAPTWLEAADDGTAELRLAASLACVYANLGAGAGDLRHMPLRRQIEPVSGERPPTWDPGAGRNVAWVEGSLVDALNAVMGRRIVLAVQQGVSSYPDVGRLWPDLGDVADFIEGRVDDARIARLLWGCMLVDGAKVEGRPLRGREPTSTMAPSTLYALLKLCFPGRQPKGASRVSGGAKPEWHQIPIVGRIHRLAAAGDGTSAARLAVRRLRASGLVPSVQGVHQQGRIAARTAAALLFPIGPRNLALLAAAAGRPRGVDQRPGDLR